MALAQSIEDLTLPSWDIDPLLAVFGERSNHQKDRNFKKYLPQE